MVDVLLRGVMAVTDTLDGVPPAPPDVQLRHIDDSTLEALVALAVRDAEPDDAMPPTAGAPGWTRERQEALRAYHAERRRGLGGPHAEATFAVVAGDAIVGSARLARVAPGTMEAGMWLGRSARGQGIGQTVMRSLLAAAATLGARTVVAETSVDNPAAFAVLLACDATLTAPSPDGRVRAVFGV